MGKINKGIEINGERLRELDIGGEIEGKECGEREGKNEGQGDKRGMPDT